MYISCIYTPSCIYLSRFKKSYIIFLYTLWGEGRKKEGEPRVRYKDKKKHLKRDFRLVHKSKRKYTQFLTHRS